MKCCIKNCANSDRLKVNQPSTSSFIMITFHLFPKDPKQRAAWEESLSIPNWMATDRAMICSKHFKEEDFYDTKQGIRRVKYGAVPVIKDDFNGPAASRICKLCLSLDRKMYQLNDYYLDKMYQDIMGMVPRTDVNNRLPMGICWECTARLQSAASFISKALICDALLQDHLKTNADLKVIDILNIHREHNNLKSSLLVQEVFKFNSLNLDEHAPNTLIKTEVIGIPNNEEIEVEVNNLINNKTTMTDEGKNDVIEETCLNNDVKTEIDLIPLTEIEIGERDFDYENHKNDNFSDNDDVVTEKVYVKSNDGKITKIDFGNIIKVKKKGDTVIDDRTTVLYKPFVDCDDQIDDNDKNVSNEMIVYIEETKTTDVKRKNDAVKRKAKTDEDDADPKWVRATKEQAYVKPSIPVDENIFTVKTLNHEDLLQEILERKDSERYKEAPFKCTVCYKGFPTEEKHTRHVFYHSEQSGPLECAVCKIRVKAARHLRSHMKQQHSTEFVCKLCPLVTRSKCVALGHMKFHAGSKYQCPQCSLEFEKRTTLLSHLRLKHMSDCVCELCGYTFVSKYGVKAHKVKKHKLVDGNAKLEGPHCEVCEVKFLNQNAYDRHLRLSSKHIKSEDDPNRLCNDSSAKSRRDARLALKPRGRPKMRHGNVNPMAARNAPLTCEHCGVELENLRTYVAHFKYSHPGMKCKFTYRTIHMCEHCGKMFYNSTTLAAHMWVHTGQKRFQCDHCNKTFTMKASLAGHMQQHEPVRRLYECRECGKHFANSGNLTRHMLVSIFTLSVAVRHMRFHAGSRYQCPHCPLEFKKQTTFISHLRLKHMSDAVCELCGYTYVSEHGVRTHKKIMHKFDNLEFKGPHCEVCEVKFLTQEAYDRHLRLCSKHINEDDPNRLSNDPCMNIRKVDKRQLKSVTPSVPVTCEQCGKVLENLRTYASHFRWSHPGIKRTQYSATNVLPSMCEHCGKMFMTLTTLACHMWVHTGKKRFQCDHCNKTFTMKTSLVAHMQQHEPVRRLYECRVCGKQLTLPRNLRRHMLIHTGLKPYKCDACEKAFKTHEELRTHVDHVHLNKPWPKRVRRRVVNLSTSE